MQNAGFLLFLPTKTSKDYEENYIFDDNPAVDGFHGLCAENMRHRICRRPCAYQGSPHSYEHNHWARTDYRGYWNMRYQFDSATVSKPGYIKATIRYRELPDTVFLLPESKQIGEVTVWGKNQENAGKMKGQACQEAVEAGRNAALGHTRLVGFDLGNMMDSQGRRDQKHLREARKVFSKMENKDPLINAYEKATGKKYELKNPINLSANKKETLEKQDETRQESSEKTLPNVQNEAKEQENEK